MHSIWAIAVNTLKHALRIKVALAFIILLLIFLPLMGVTLTGDGTAKGRLQVFVSYSLSLTSLLLCLLTILVSVYLLTSDIKDKQIFNLDMAAKTFVPLTGLNWMLTEGKLLNAKSTGTSSGCER